MELGLEEFLVRQDGLVLGDQRGRKRAAHGIFHHFIVLARAEQDTDGGPLVLFAYIAIQASK
jgi:hypothetical protein